MHRRVDRQSEVVREPAGQVILASRSPRRAELLTAAGISFEVLAADIDETPHANEAPAAYVERLAIEKARAVFALRPEARVLGADTTVTIDGEILGKPVDEADALRMLRLLNGRPHEVHTGVALVSAAGVRSAVDTTRVWFSADDRRRHLVVRRDRRARRSRRRLCHPGLCVAFHPPDRGLVQQRCGVAGRSGQ